VERAAAMKAGRRMNITPAAMKATAAMPAAARSLGEGRTGRSDGQGRQCTNYEPTHFPGCHDRSPSFL
jgi:hypothetical protein